jgi:phosphoadenosine phosphosulfate reductase
MNDLPFAEFSLDSLTDLAVKTLRAYEPTGGYWGCFSGGKDSCVIKELARIAGVKAVWHYNVTTIDPPELVRFIRHEHPDVLFEKPAMSFWQLARKKGFPTRRHRWCCEHLKERKTPLGARLIMGVRAAESASRAKNWKEVKLHFRTKAVTVSPILYWRDSDVWDFIRGRNLPYCSLYDEGFHRLGCIGCPMARRAGRLKEFARWPVYERMWQRLFRDLHERRSQEPETPSSRRFASWQDLWHWWLSDEPIPDDTGCPSLIDMMS